MRNGYLYDFIYSIYSLGWPILDSNASKPKKGKDKKDAKRTALFYWPNNNLVSYHVLKPSRPCRSLCSAG
mgnify:FL=1